MGYLFRSTKLTRLTLLSISALLFPATLVVAQKSPMKWGDISNPDLAMRNYAPDTSAHAVVLGDYGTVVLTAKGPSRVEVQLKRHRRVKILSKSAYNDWGTYTISYYARGRSQRIEKLEAQTVVLHSDGSREVHKLDKASFYDEDVNGYWRRIRFTLPALAPGSIIEYRYTLKSSNPTYLGNWFFQSDIPTLHSEFRVEYPEIVHYTFLTKGSIIFDKVENDTGNGSLGPTSMKRWVARDVPALPEEPFTKSIDEYRGQLESQISYIEDPNTGQPLIQYTSTWDELAEELWDIPEFGKRIGGKGIARDQAQALVAGIQDPVEQMKVIYNYVRQNVSWNEKYTYLAQQKLNDVLTSGQGNVAEMALLLVSMLRNAGLQANPVLISTRKNGAVQPLYPSLRQFDYVLTHVKIGEEIFILDPTEVLSAYNMLPIRALNGVGLLLMDGRSEWINITPASRYVRQVVVHAEIEGDGTLSGKLQTTDAGYSSMEQRQRLADLEEEAFITDVALDGVNAPIIEHYALQNKEAVDENLKTEVQFSVQGFAQVAGEFIYVQPFMLDRIEENPLRLPERTFPVDYAYSRNQVYTFSFKIPEGYTVQELPGNMRVSLSSGGSAFQRFIQVQDNMLTVQARLAFSKTSFEPEQYTELRQYYDQVIAAQHEQVVLKKTEDAGQ